jgi:transposase
MMKKEQRLGYAKQCALLPNWKLEHPFLWEVPAQALQQSLKNLDRAYDGCATANRETSWNLGRQPV